MTTLITVNEGMVNEMWSKYLKNVDDYDKRLTDGWKDDANGVLVYVSLHLPVPMFITMTFWETGLFSAIVAAFIIESYKRLSPDSSSQSVFYLEQLSQQFAGFANGTHVPLQFAPSPPPSTSIICVNILWLLSLLLSTTSALFATLMMQWARIYIDLPQIPSAPRERARVRSVLFFGTEKYRMHLAVEMAPRLLHLSVFLFFAGLIIFFFVVTVYQTVAIVLSIFVGVFAVVYLVCTILPCIDNRSPYRTPMSSVLWYTWQASFFSVTFFLSWLLRLFHCCLVPYNFGDVTSFRQRILNWCISTIDGFYEKHLQNIKDGFQRSIVQGALDAPKLVDHKALTRLFARGLDGLAEYSKIQEFVPIIPGDTIVQLMSGPKESGRTVFHDRLLSLLRSCTPDTVWLDEDMRRRRLLVCLNAIHHIAKASAPPYGVSQSEFLRVLSDVRINFANIRLMQLLWADTDPSIRIISRSICALLARHLLRKRPLEGVELAWLEEVMAKPSNTIFNGHNNHAAVDSMNADAFVDGVFLYQRGDLPNELVISFKDTLMVLMNTNNRAFVHPDTFDGWLFYHIERIEQENVHRDRDNVVRQLRRMSSSIAGTSRPQTQAQSPASDTWRPNVQHGLDANE